MSLSNKHAIQLKKVIVRELAFKKLSNKECGDISVKLNVGHSPFQPESHIITVSLKCGIDENPSFSVNVEVSGVFEVDTDHFDIAFINEWAQKNAPYILHPYLREQLYSLTMHAGVEPLLLPLVQVPTTRETVKPPKKTIKK